jgi:hypothetical protein
VSPLRLNRYSRSPYGLFCSSYCLRLRLESGSTASPMRRSLFMPRANTVLPCWRGATITSYWIPFRNQGSG